MPGIGLILCLFLMSFQAWPLWAQKPEAEADKAAAADESANVALQEIEVRSIVRRDELQSTSATSLENKGIYDHHYITPIDILKRSPGVSIRQGGDFGVASSVNIRGFWGAHHYGGRLLVTVDGIPIHDGGHADGYIDAHIINPLEIESVEIIKGPSSVYYGHQAEGGVAAFQTIRSGDFTRPTTSTAAPGPMKSKNFRTTAAWISLNYRFNENYRPILGGVISLIHPKTL